MHDRDIDEAVANPAAAPTPEGIAALQPGRPLAGRFAVVRKDRQQAKNGSPYLSLELRDRTGSIPARIFRDVDLIGSRFERGDAVEVRGKVERFRGATPEARQEGSSKKPSRHARLDAPGRGTI